MKIAFLLPWLCLLSFLPAAADEIKAYGVPADISYVRIMNFSNDPVEGYRLNGENVDPLGFQQIGKYYPVKGYSAKLHHQDVVMEKEILPGRFYSFVQMDGPNKLLFFEEEKLLNPARAFIRFYNLTDRPILELKADARKILIALAKQTDLGTNDIDTIPVKLGVYANRSLVAEVPDIKLQAGKASTIVVVGEGKGLKVIVD